MVLQRRRSGGNSAAGEAPQPPKGRAQKFLAKGWGKALAMAVENGGFRRVTRGWMGRGRAWGWVLSSPSAGSPTETVLRLKSRCQQSGHVRPPRLWRSHRVDRPAFRHRQLQLLDGRCVQDPGTYSPRRADPRLLAIPSSCGQVADRNSNFGGVGGFARAYAVASRWSRHCNACVAQPIGAMTT